MKNIFSYNEKKQAHGYWLWHWGNGNIWYKGNYLNNKRHDYWEEYHSNGKPRLKEFYI